MDINILLDKAKKLCGVTTDKDLATALGVTPSAVTNYRKGRALPDAVTCATLAGLTGEPLARVLGVVGEERAISREEKAVWRKLAATAAMALCVMATTLPGTAKAATAGFQAGASSAGMYIMFNLRWVGHLVGLWVRSKFGKPARPYIEARI